MKNDPPIHFGPNDLPDPHQDPDFDKNLVECMLALTPTERLERHEQWRQFQEIARQARIARYGYDPAVPETSV
ncbi:MAG: hypothetical protein NTU53_16785 [Planctomycetota bacterium]|nr:hypothetical protein [Planctomycetota bacterium]